MSSVFKLTRRKTVKASYSKLEVTAGEFVPYHYHWDKETIITKRRELMQVIKIEGFSFETADDEDVDMKKIVRNSLFKSMADGKFAMWTHTIRRRHSAFPGGTMPSGFAYFLNEMWHKKHHTKNTFINDLYISVIRKEDTAGAAKVESIFNRLSEGASKDNRAEALKECHKELREAVFRIMATFRDYGARVLGVYENENGVFSEPLEFLGRLVNCGFSQPMAVPNMDISRYLPTCRMYFGGRAVEVRGPSQKKFAGIVSIKEYSPVTQAGILDAFLQLPFEFIIAQSFIFTNRQANLSKMQLQQRRMMASQDLAVSQIAEISEALDMAMSGHIAFGMHHLTVMCMEDNLQVLEDSIAMVIAELVNVGINPVREKSYLEQSYWAQLPANFEFIGRSSNISTMNFAGFASLHNYPPGKIKGNHWGDALTVFDTTSGTPYFFNFHLRDVGHTTVIGPTGAGKTVLLNFLCAQAMKYNCRMFFFDKDRGAEIFIRALGGKYSIITPADNSGFNPLKLSDTTENRNFLSEWLKTMLTTHGENFSADDGAKVNEAVVGNYKLDSKDRVLHNIAAFLGMEGPGTLASRLKVWHGKGQYARLFDNEEDIVDFHSSNVFGFEMNEVLSDKASLAPTLLYLFHRINLSLDGTPTVIILDEAWALIDNKIFASKIKDWLKTLRKLNAMVVFATQSVEDATKSDISDTLIQQTATQIFLPNPKATEAYRAAFMLSEREFNLLKTTDPGSRFFLVKQGKDVVVARIDLSGMDDAINVLSARAETVSILDQVMEEFGDNPEDWLPIFLERVKR